MPGRPMRRASSRWVRWAGLAAVAVTTLVASGFVLAPVAVRALVQMFSLLLRGSLWLATAIGRGDDSWTIAAAVGRGMTTALVTPGAMGVLGGLLLLGAVALFGLQRLLDSEEEESSQ
jgi:hypothetical protein